jgi:hypothetical protein
LVAAFFAGAFLAGALFAAAFFVAATVLPSGARSLTSEWG